MSQLKFVRASSNDKRSTPFGKKPKSPPPIQRVLGEGISPIFSRETISIDSKQSSKVVLQMLESPQPAPKVNAMSSHWGTLPASLQLDLARRAKIQQPQREQGSQPHPKEQFTFFKQPESIQVNETNPPIQYKEEEIIIEFQRSPQGEVMVVTPGKTTLRSYANQEMQTHSTHNLMSDVKKLIESKSSSQTGQITGVPHEFDTAKLSGSTQSNQMKDAQQQTKKKKNLGFYNYQISMFSCQPKIEQRELQQQRRLHQRFGCQRSISFHSIDDSATPMSEQQSEFAVQTQSAVASHRRVATLKDSSNLSSQSNLFKQKPSHHSKQSSYLKLSKQVSKLSLHSIDKETSTYQKIISTQRNYKNQKTKQLVK